MNKPIQTKTGREDPAGFIYFFPNFLSARSIIISTVWSMPKTLLLIMKSCASLEPQTASE